MIGKLIEKYSSLVVSRPVTVFAFSLLFTAFLAAGATQVEVVEQNTEDFLPDSFPSIQAFETISAEFGSAEATSYTVLIESNPSYSNSNEIRDMRNPRLLNYVRLIEQEAMKMDRVTSVESAADLFSDIPESRSNVSRVLETLGEERWGRFISNDYSATRIEVQARGLSAEEQQELASDLRYNIESNPQPPGIELSYTGQTYIDQAFQEQSRNTNQTTTTVAFLLVLVVVILLFRSIYYGLTSLQTLVFGIAAGFGAFGWLGFNLSPATSGAISIGVGIAIDFGIQPVSRYREERNEEGHGMKESLSTTIKGVARPMTLGMIAALMGFSSLSLGRITFLSSLGIMLSLTTFFAYISAFTVIPSTVIIHDRYISSRMKKIRQSFRISEARN